MTEGAMRRLGGPVILLIATAITLLPLIWMLWASFRLPVQAGGGFGIGNYASALGARPFHLYLLNSVFAALASVAITLVLSVTAGYALAKFRFRGIGLVWLLSLAAVMVPLEAIVIPLFLQVHAFGWTNSYAGLILPTAFNVVGVFIFRQAMLAIPNDYIEAARIDGASEPRILWSIVLPMLWPTIGVVAGLTFNLVWNSYLWPLVVTSDDPLRTLPLGMVAFQRSFNTQYGQVMAVSIFGAIPTLLFFVALQRSFVEGAATTGLKA